MELIYLAVTLMLGKKGRADVKVQSTSEFCNVTNKHQSNLTIFYTTSSVQS